MQVIVYSILAIIFLIVFISLAFIALSIIIINVYLWTVGAFDQKMKHKRISILLIILLILGFFMSVNNALSILDFLIVIWK